MTLDQLLDLSNDIYKSIDSYICDLDNDISITNDHSYLGESLELSVPQTVQDVVTSSGTDVSVHGNFNDGSGDCLVFDKSHASESSIDANQAESVGVNEAEKPVEDPFVEKMPSQEHEFVIQSPFSKHSLDMVVQEPDQGVYQPIFGDNNVGVQEARSATIDDFKGLKAGDKN